MKKQVRYPRVRVSLPPEGLVFIVILGFVTVCSILRNVNLLVIVSGMMFVSLLFCWRLSRSAVRNVIVGRVTPKRTHAGQSVSMQWLATNMTDYPIFGLKITDRIKQTCSRNGTIQSIRKWKDRNTNGQVVFDRINGGETIHSSYQVLFTERGIYELGPSYVESNFPLSLVKSWFRTDQATQIYVAPRMGRLSNQWDQLIKSSCHGSSSKSSVEGAEEEEFFAIREYRSGDNTRKIHWRSTAKRGHPMVKQFERTTERSFAIILDLYHGSESSIAESQIDEMSAACEVILSFATTVLSKWVDAASGKLVVGISGEKVECFSSAHQPNFYQHTMRSLATAQAGAGFHLNQTITDVSNLISAETPCFVISTRSIDGATAQFDAAAKTRMHWIRTSDNQFDEIFSQASNPAHPNINSQFSYLATG